MLKNMQEAKFASALIPIAGRVLTPGAKEDLSFNYFFTHILAHELSHGIGPHQIQVAGRATTPRQELKELYSAIEEAKADVTGLFMLEYLYDHKLMDGPRRTSARSTPRIWRRRSAPCGSASPKRTARAWRCSSTISWTRARSRSTPMARSRWMCRR